MNIHIVKGLLNECAHLIQPLFEASDFSFEKCMELQRKYDRSEPLPPYSWHGARGLLCMASATSWVPLSQEIRIPGYLSNLPKRPNVEIGDYTYYSDHKNSPEKFYDNIEHHYEFLGDKLIIGKFCAIAEGVKFIMNGANHRMDGITTYPFNIFGCGWEKVTPTIEQLPFKGDTVIGNDVWIGQNVTIMPGVIIGDGAIIAANSTVVKSVEPYSIYSGNPAKFIKKRFSDEKIEFLLKLEWWNWSGEEIFDNLEILTSEAGLEELMNKYSKRDAIN